MILFGIFLVCWLVVAGLILAKTTSDEIGFGLFFSGVAAILLLALTTWVFRQVLPTEVVSVRNVEIVEFEEGGGIYAGIGHEKTHSTSMAYAVKNLNGFRVFDMVDIDRVIIIEEEGIEKPYLEEFDVIYKGLWRYFAFCDQELYGTVVIHIPPKSVEINYDFMDEEE